MKRRYVLRTTHLLLASVLALSSTSPAFVYAEDIAIVEEMTEISETEIIESSSEEETEIEEMETSMNELLPEAPIEEEITPSTEETTLLEEISETIEEIMPEASSEEAIELSTEDDYIIEPFNDAVEDNTYTVQGMEVTISNGVATITGTATADCKLNYDDTVTEIYCDFVPNANGHSFREFFSKFPNVEKITFGSNIINNTKLITDISAMFSGCSKLASIDLSGWNISHITDISYLFNGCESLSSVNLSGWNTSHVTDMSYLFYNCHSITSFAFVQNLDVSNVTSMRSTFGICPAFTSIDLSAWNTGSVTNMEYMFESCTGLISLDLSNWNVGNVTSIGKMFSDSTSLTSLNLNGWNTDSLTSLYATFSGCTSLVSLDVSGWNTSNVKNIQSTFYDCKSLTDLDLSSWDWSNAKTGSGTFSKCNSLHVIKTPINSAKDVSLGADYYPLNSLTIDTNTSYNNIPANMATSLTLVKDNNHNWSDYALQADGRYLSICSGCGAERECTHTYTEINRSDATCSEQGSIQYTCSTCGDIHTEYTDAATGHAEGDIIIENIVDATCESNGSYDKVIYCTKCNDEMRRETIETETIPHISSEPVIENEVKATCTDSGSYDEIIRCTTCKKELSKETFYIDATGHDWNEGIISKQVTCIEAGELLFTCGTCNDTYTEIINAVGHIEGEPVIENEIPATAITKGSYDEVIYCQSCGVELSRETFETDVLTDLTVIIPASLELTEDEYGNYSASDVVSAYGNMSENKLLKVSTDDTVSYINTDDTSVTAQGSVMFGIDGMEVWTAEQTHNSVTMLDSRDIHVTMSKDNIFFAGTYNGIIYFHIDITDTD